MNYYIACDLGTTFVELALTNDKGEILIKSGFLNPQKKFGSDVISRITNSNRGYLQELNRLIIDSIEDEVSRLINDAGVSKGEVIAIIISGNTVMNSIVLGLDIKSLGEAPFIMPFNKTSIISISGINSYVLPGTSAFLGADLLSGTNYIGLMDGDILMDLGTNGEIVLKNNGRLYATTAACGPAFENCARARGIYGSTTLEHIANLIQRKIVSPDLTLTEEQIGSGIISNLRGERIIISAEILRSISVAVSAIYSSLIMLMKKAKLPIENVNKVYIAGGFGFYMKLSSCQKIGLIPKALIDKAVICKNTSLLGAIKIAIDLDEELEAINKLKENIEVYQFGGDKEYEELFLNSILLTER